MAFLNEIDLVENVEKFPVLYDKSNDEFHEKEILKNGWTLLNPVE